MQSSHVMVIKLVMKSHWRKQNRARRKTREERWQMMECFLWVHPSNRNSAEYFSSHPRHHSVFLSDSPSLKTVISWLSSAITECWSGAEPYIFPFKQWSELSSQIRNILRQSDGTAVAPRGRTNGQCWAGSHTWQSLIKTNVFVQLLGIYSAKCISAGFYYGQLDFAFFYS